MKQTKQQQKNIYYNTIIENNKMEKVTLFILSNLHNLQILTGEKLYREKKINKKKTNTINRFKN